MNRVACTLVVTLLACSSSHSGPDGAGARGGGTSVGSAGNGTGGSGAQGNPGGQAGGTSGGGAPGAQGGNTGSTSGMPSGNCPAWPLAKLFPFPGPFFYGPDPGPCQTNDGSTTFSYANGRVQSDTDGVAHQLETFTWQGDRLTSSSAADLISEYTYSPGYATIVTTGPNVPTLTQTYRLDSSGYPLDITADRGAGPAQWIKYVYVGCLLDRRIETDANGNELSSPEYEPLRYMYDAQGHVLARGQQQFDYSCWQAASGGAGGTSGTGDPGSAGNAPDSSVGCPAWPTKKLSPFLGSFFYGPDPGPCSWTDGMTVRTFNYSGDVLQSITSSDGGSETLTWDGERLMSSTETTAAGASRTTQYSYSADSLTLTTSSSSFTATTTYRLSPAGYPLSREYSYKRSDGSSSPVETTTYEYVNCRLSGYPDGYDAAGHLMGVFPTNGIRLIPYGTGTPDYGCWKH